MLGAYALRDPVRLAPPDDDRGVRARRL